mgnify:CR=1 FL=1
MTNESAPVEQRDRELAKALSNADWSGLPIGNKVLLQAAIDSLNRIACTHTAVDEGLVEQVARALAKHDIRLTARKPKPLSLSPPHQSAQRRWRMRRR